MLDSAERQVRSGPGWTIDEHHPGLDLRCRSLCSRLVVAEDHSRKPKGSVVCDPYGLCLVSDSEHQKDGTEEFFLVGRIVGIDVREDRRLAIKPGSIQLFPAMYERRSRFHRAIYLIQEQIPRI